MTTVREKAKFIEPMECRPSAHLPTAPGWTYEIKLDGYRLESIAADGKVKLYSRNAKSLTEGFPAVAGGLAGLPDQTILDGELTALDSRGQPDFSLLQNYRTRNPEIVYFVFDLLMLAGRSLLRVPLIERRRLLAATLAPSRHVELAQQVGDLDRLRAFVAERGLEGIVAKREDSFYWPGKHNDCWRKQRFNTAQEFVIGGYRKGHLGIESLLVGYYRGKHLYFAGRVRAGFVPLTRKEVFACIEPLRAPSCPFVNLPDKTEGPFSEGITPAEMRGFTWLRPEAVAHIEFLEWTAHERLRHPKFIGLRFDKPARKVIKEDPS